MSNNDDLDYTFDDDYDDDESLYDNCPKCGRTYDHIDYDYQSCSKCGWDTTKNTFGETREPDDDDFANGDADLLTGQWI